MFSKNLDLTETDDEFFSALDNSNYSLSNIFCLTKEKGPDIEPSLKYSAPKETKTEKCSTDNQVNKQTAWSVHAAKVVTAFKLVNQDNICQGKVGLALLKNSRDDMKIILYKTKTDILCILTIGKDVKMYLKGPYLQFNDNLGLFWSVLFENNEEDFIDLIREKVIFHQTKVVIKDDSSKDKAHIVSDSVQEMITKDTDKSNILSRMAKMGKALPTLAGDENLTDMSDSSDSVKISTTKPLILTRKPKTHQQINTTSKLQSTLVPASQNSLAPSELVRFNQTNIPESHYMSMLLTENRQQNTEIRMNISKLETKIEKVLDKMSFIKNSDGTKDKDDEILDLEEKVLELRKENRSLKQSLKLNHSSNVDYLQDHLGVLEMLGILTSEAYQMAPLDLSKHILRKTKSHADFLKNEIEALSKSCEDFKIENSNLKQGNAMLELEVQKLKNEKQNGDDKNRRIDNIVKKLMNNLFHNLSLQFKDTQNRTLNATEILQICGSAIKQETEIFVANSIHK